MLLRTKLRISHTNYRLITEYASFVGEHVTDCIDEAHRYGQSYFGDAVNHNDAIMQWLFDVALPRIKALKPGVRPTSGPFLVM